MAEATSSPSAEKVQLEDPAQGRIVPSKEHANSDLESRPHSPDRERNARWTQWSMTIFDRLPLPFNLTVLLLTLLMIAEQLLEISILYPSITDVELSELSLRFALPSLTVYMLLIMRVLKRRAVSAVVKLRPYVQISDEDYEEHVRRMVRPSRRGEAVTLIISILIVVGLFVLLGMPVPTLGPLPSSPPVAIFIMVAYILFGWLGLLFVYTGIKHSLGLGELARQPLTVNIFDPDNLLPFGNLSFVHSLALVGLVLILIILMGRPTTLTSLVPLGLATPASVLALIVPIWGVHRQIDYARERAHVRICNELNDVHTALYAEKGTAQEDIGAMADRTSALVNLRKMIQEAPNWPFRDTTAIARAITAAMSPLIYFILIETIRIYIVPMLGG
jgi:hypothetical protein